MPRLSAPSPRGSYSPCPAWPRQRPPRSPSSSTGSARSPTPQRYVTTSQFRDINVRLTSNPRDTYVKAVRCDHRGDISTAKRFRANDHRVHVIASNARDGTCFRLNFDAPTLATFTVVGRVSTWWWQNRTI